MPVQPTYPGLYIEELPSSTHTIAQAPTSITAFVGYTHPLQGSVAQQKDGKGWGQAYKVFNFADYVRLFGGLYDDRIFHANVANAVNQFFLNGGSSAIVIPLMPQYTPPGGHSRQPVVGASVEMGSIRFTARQLTSDDMPISIKVDNVRGATADITVGGYSSVTSYTDVTLTQGPKYIETVLAPSDLVSVEPKVKAAGYTAPFAAGDEVLATMPHNDPVTGGATFLVDDFTDALGDEKALDKVDIFNLLVVPGVADTSVWTKGLKLCENKKAFYVMDPPSSWCADDTYTGDGVYTKVEDQIDTLVPHIFSNGAIYFPYLKTYDQFSKETVEQPPSGFVAGVYARIDGGPGVWKAPAGLDAAVVNTTGVVDSGKMTDMRQGTVNPLGVNVLRDVSGSGTVIWGARTVATNPSVAQWKYVPVRRMALFIEQTLLRNLGWVVFEPNDEPLWSAIRTSVGSFMLSLFRQQAFEGSTPSAAFAVQCDSTTTTQDDIDNGIVNIVVAFRPLKPAEFVVIKIAQLAGQVQ
jgi:uncharacterized protein